MENNQPPEDELNFVNPLKSHYEDPKLNTFDGGIAEGMNALDLKEKCTLWIRYPRNINKNGLFNIMKSYGNVTRIFVPNNNNNNNIQQNQSIAFVDYKNFADAERAIRGLNSSNNSGLGIKAQISHGSRKKSPEPAPKPAFTTESDTAEEQNEVTHASINFIDFSSALKINENRERVTEFEFQAYETQLISPQRDKLKQLAKDSNWIYSENFDRAQFKPEILHKNFLEYLCCQCNRTATMRDDNTKKYYCSLSCFQNLNDGQDDSHVMLKKSDKVIISSIINEKCMYVRRCQDDLIHMLEQIYRAAKRSLNPLEMVPNIGDEVLAKCYDGIYRGEVLEIIIEDDTGVDVVIRLIDIGCTTSVKMEDLFEMTPECRKFSLIVQKIFLKDVNVTSINMDVINYLTDLRDGQKELIIKSLEQVDDQIIVDLKDEDGKFLTEKITRLAKFDNVNLNSRTINSLPTLPTSTGVFKKLFVINKKMLDSSGVIWCLEEKFLKDFYEMQKSINEYGNSLRPETFGANTDDMVLVKMNDQWYRACMQEKRGDGTPSCCFVDLCDTCNVPIENIFTLPSIFTNYPMYSECYEIHKFMDATEKKKKFINSYIHENNFIIADEVKNTKNGLVIHFST